MDASGWELPRGKYVFEDHGMLVMCLVLDAMVGDQTVIGNYQENTQVVYDLCRDVLPFAPAQFDKLVASVIVFCTKVELYIDHVNSADVAVALN